jgi:peptidoglycan hydrolase-like protein with peptidoglycan-binding domain
MLPSCSTVADVAHQRRAGQWNTTPQGVDGNSGPHTKASVVAFQAWAGAARDGVVGDRLGLFPCTRRAPRWRQRSAYSSWPIDPKRQKREAGVLLGPCVRTESS